LYSLEQGLQTSGTGEDFLVMQHALLSKFPVDFEDDKNLESEKRYSKTSLIRYRLIQNTV